MDTALACGDSIFFDDHAPEPVIEDVNIENISAKEPLLMNSFIASSDKLRFGEENQITADQTTATITLSEPTSGVPDEKPQKTKSKKRTRSYSNGSDQPTRRSQRRNAKNEKSVDLPKNDCIEMSLLETYKSVLRETNKFGHNITWAPEVEYSKLNLEYIKEFVIDHGVPIVLKNSLDNWDLSMFNLDWLQTHCSETPLINSPRDNDAYRDLSGWTMGRYIDYVKTPPNERKPPRLYGKDLPCPDEWTKYVADHIYPFLAYRGEYDLINNLESELQPLSLMTYVAVDNTFTPGHMDICGSMGHNIMVSCDPDSYALWFVVSRNDRHEAAQFWEQHGGSIDRDSNLLPMSALSEAPFMVYCIAQKPGDFVLVPPLSPHQVINKGGTNIKVSWNTVTPQSIHLSYLTLRELHLVAKPEVYRIKAAAYATILKYTTAIEQWAASSFPPSPNITQQQHRSMRSVLNVFEDTVFQEDIDLEYVFKTKKSPLVSLLEESNVQTQPVKFQEDTAVHSRVCNFCHCDIFNRCFHCNHCDSKYSGGLDMCMDCAAEGRGCVHIKELVLMEYLSIDHLKAVLERARQAMHLLGQKLGLPDLYLALPKPFRGFRDLSGATVAFHRMALTKEGQMENCHHCKRKKPRSTLISCTTCPKKFCENCLWNRHGMKLSPLLRKPVWVCLACTGTCNCAVCLRKQGKDPYDEDAVDLSFLSSAKSLDEFGVNLSHEHNELRGKTDTAPTPRIKNRDWFKKKVAPTAKPEAELGPNTNPVEELEIIEELTEAPSTQKETLVPIDLNQDDV